MRYACGQAATEFAQNGQRIEVHDRRNRKWTIILTRSITRNRKFHVRHAHLEDYQQ